jgi:hypothetical protein
MAPERDRSIDVLILTFPADWHAIVVDQALARKGVNSLRWLGTGFSSDQVGTFEISDRISDNFEIRDSGTSINSRNVRTVWARRPTFPVPNGDVIDSDKKHVVQENCLFIQGIWWQLSSSSKWVNRYSSRRFVKSKMNQLKTAKSVGFRIPDTIFSNDPDRIQPFLSRLGEKGGIYKPHRVSEWVEGGSRHLLHCANVDNVNDISDIELSMCAGIFQERIEKAYELRIHVLGGFCLSVKIDSQITSEGRQDWRSASPEHLALEEVRIPEAWEDKCMELVKRLGLSFGIIDAIVTPSDDIVFLEINEMGQFLWIEGANPEIRMLDHFCRFLSAENPDLYDGSSNGVPTPYSDIRTESSAREIYDCELASMAPPDVSVEWIDVLV